LKVVHQRYPTCYFLGLVFRTGTVPSKSEAFKPTDIIRYLPGNQRLAILEHVLDEKTQHKTGLIKC
jgi:hypothetical protein